MLGCNGWPVQSSSDLLYTADVEELNYTLLYIKYSYYQKCFHLLGEANQGMLEETKGVIRRRKSKNDKQYNTQIKTIY
jgi:hypothetical protein